MNWHERRWSQLPLGGRQEITFLFFPLAFFYSSVIYFSQIRSAQIKNLIFHKFQRAQKSLMGDYFSDPSAILGPTYSHFGFWRQWVHTPVAARVVYGTKFWAWCFQKIFLLKINCSSNEARWVLTHCNFLERKIISGLVTTFKTSLGPG